MTLKQFKKQYKGCGLGCYKTKTELRNALTGAVAQYETMMSWDYYRNDEQLLDNFRATIARNKRMLCELGELI